MKLFYNPPSPYARNVLVVIHEKGLAGRVALEAVDPWVDPQPLLAATPIGKVPALVTDDDMVLTESTLICDYLDGLGPGRALGADDCLRIAARRGLAQGLIDAGFGTVIERRRPPERQWPDWIARQRRAIERALARAGVADDRFDLGDIALACGLAYLDFRLPEIGWRQSHPALAAWLDHVSRRHSMRATRA